MQISKFLTSLVTKILIYAMMDVLESLKIAPFDIAYQSAKALVSLP